MSREAKKITGPQIVDRLGAEQVVTAFRLLGLSSILRSSIIGDDYSPRIELSSAITLTAKGSGVARRVSLDAPGRAKASPSRSGQAKYPKESQLMCLLELGNGEPLVDLEKIDVEAVRAAVSAEVREKQVRHPYIFGPLLYEKASEMFPDLLEDLNHRQTVSLLQNTEQGVFQVQEWLSGPFGVLSVSEKRTNPPILRAPLQHCHDISCTAVHDIWLNTSGIAQINVRRELIYNHLPSGADAEEWEWREAFKLVSEEDPKAFRDDTFSNLLPLLGDALVLQEKRLLLTKLISANWTSFRDGSEHRQSLKSAEKYANNLSDAECLQEILWFEDAAIAAAIDDLVLATPSEVVIPGGEVRRSVLARPRGFGHFRTRTEISRNGIRVMGSRDLAPLRLERAVDEMARDRESQVEMAWRLREFTGDDVSTKIDEAIRRGELIRIIDSLLTYSRSSAEKACSMVGLDSKHVDNLRLPSLIAWKMGFDVPLRSDVFARFENESQLFRRAIASQSALFTIEVDEFAEADLSSASDSDRDIRAAASHYFVTMEQALGETIAFSAWALTANHFAEMDSFKFNPSDALKFAARRLNPLLSDGGQLDEKKPTLGPLVEALLALAKLLEGGIGEGSVGDSFPVDRIPEASSKSDLIKFPFSTTSLFDSLTSESKIGIIECLKSAHATIVSSGIVGVRNSQLHYTPNSAAVGDLGKNVGSVLEAIRELDATGLVPALSSLQEVKRGRWGKSVYVHTVQARRRVELYSPTMVFAGLLPRLSADQLIIPRARLEEGGEPLRFAIRVPSSYSRMWKSVPNRRRKGVGESSSIGGLGIGEVSPPR